MKQRIDHDKVTAGEVDEIVSRVAAALGVYSKSNTIDAMLIRPLKFNKKVCRLAVALALDLDGRPVTRMHQPQISHNPQYQADKQYATCSRCNSVDCRLSSICLLWTRPKT